MRKFWAISAEIAYGNETGQNPRREVVNVHPLIWATTYERKHRCSVRLLHWESISSTEAVRLRKYTLDD